MWCDLSVENSFTFLNKRKQFILFGSKCCMLVRHTRPRGKLEIQKCILCCKKIMLEDIKLALFSSCNCTKNKNNYFSRFDEKENVSNCIQLKTSVIKGIKNQLLEQFPDIESWLNHIMPKKDPVKIVRWY